MEKLFHFTNDGFRLAASLHLPDASVEGGAPGVVIFHGLTGHRIGPHFLLVKLARALAASGIAALRFDFRGSGESEMAFQDMSILTELSDANAALNRMRMSAGVDQARIGALGHSMGAVVLALLACNRPDLRAMALWAPVAHYAEMLQQEMTGEAQAAIDKYGALEKDGHIYGARFGEDGLNARPRESIAKSTAPALLVHGDADETAPVSESHAFQKVLNERADGAAELEIIAGADHSFLGVSHAAAAIERTVSWFRETL